MTTDNDNDLNLPDVEGSSDSSGRGEPLLLFVKDFNQGLQRTLFVAALAGRPEAGVAALDALNITATAEHVLGMADTLREFSAERCWFCGEKNQHPTGWSTMSWAELAHVACPCLAEYRGTRKVLFPRWETRLAEIAERVHGGALRGSTILYTDRCSCGTLFKVTAKNAAVAYVSTGKFAGWNRCPACVRRGATQKRRTAALPPKTLDAPRKKGASKHAALTAPLNLPSIDALLKAAAALVAKGGEGS